MNKSKHKVGDLLYHPQIGLGWISKIYEEKYATKPFYVEWLKEVFSIRSLEFYNDKEIIMMKQVLNEQTQSG